MSKWTCACCKIPESKLFVSEPNPSWFGNSGNEPRNKDWTNKNWLKSRFHFSFAEYNHPGNSSFGVLRVMNDDLVQPFRGFGNHPHRNMEICTYVLEGELSHKDSMGSERTIGRGALQFMSSGTGIQHSEHNRSKDKPLRFIQLWFTPRRMNQRPMYGDYTPSASDREDRWLHLVGDADNERSAGVPIRIGTDVNIHVTELSKEGVEIQFLVQKDRQAYMLCMEGGGDVKLLDAERRTAGRASFTRHDGLEIFGPCTLTLTAAKGTLHAMLVEMAKDGRGGRTD